MTTPPVSPRIYHISHIENLQSIVADGILWSDAKMNERGGPRADVGMDEIKERRLNRSVDCHPGDKVGDYVPFYFCPRSVMLFLLKRGNHPNLDYRGGQEPILHFEANLLEVIDWAGNNKIRWTFTTRNAASSLAHYFNTCADLSQIDWDAVGARDWRDSDVKEAKQAEFLVYGRFPWDLVKRIGVYAQGFKTRAEEYLSAARHRPPVEVIQEWYY